MTLRYPSHKIASMERYVAESTTSAAAGSTIPLTDRTLVRLDFSGNGTVAVESGSEDGQFRILMVETVSGSSRIENNGNIQLVDRAWLPQLPGEVLGLMWNATDAKWYEVFRSIKYDTVSGIYVKNITGSPILRGSVVYIDGATGNNPHITLADYTTEQHSARTIGLVRETISNNDFGYVITNGLVENVNTGGMTAGQSVYLGASGAFTNIKPQAPNHMVKVGNVIRANGSVGSIQVWISNGFEIDELHDVQIISPTNGQTLTYDSATSLWKNTTPGGGSGTVTNVSVVTANGLAGSVANPTTTPAITLSTTVTGILKGNGTAISAATSGTDYAPATSGTSLLYGNGAGGFSNATVGTSLSFSAGSLTRAALTGDVTAAANNNATTIANNAVTNAKLADMATATIKGRVTAGTGDPEDLTGTQATTLLDTFTSTLKGLAPASGGGTTNFLRADGTWAAPTGGSGDVTGPASSTDNGIARFDGTTGKIIQDGSGVTLSDTGTFARAGTISVSATGAGSDINLDAADDIFINAADTITGTGTTINLQGTNTATLFTSGQKVETNTTSIEINAVDTGADINIKADDAITATVGNGSLLTIRDIASGNISTFDNQKILNTVRIENPDGSLAAPSYTFSSSNKTGICMPTVGQLVMVTGNQNALLLDATAVTSAYVPSIITDNTGMAVGHNSSIRDLTLNTASTPRVTIAGNGNYTEINSALAYDPAAIVNLTADNQAVTVGARSYLRVSSNTATATDRTFTISNGVQLGHVLVITCTSNACELQSSANVVLTNTMTFNTNDFLHLIWNGVDWVEIGRSSAGWTYVRLATDFSTTTTGNTLVTGFSFLPSPNKIYEIEAKLLVRTSVTTTGPRPGIQYSNNLTDAASRISSPSSNTAVTFRNQGTIATANAASTGLPTTADSYLAIADCTLITNGTTATVPWGITLASETSGTSVTMKANSFFRYREVP